MRTHAKKLLILSPELYTATTPVVPDEVPTPDTSVKQGDGTEFTQGDGTVFTW